MAFAMIFLGEFHKNTESTNVRPTNGTSQETRGNMLSTVRGRRFSIKSSVSRKSSVSSGARRSSIDVSASIVSEEHKEEEHPFEDVEEHKHKEEERPFEEDVDTEVTLGSGEQKEEKSPDVENGTSVVAKSSLRSSFRVLEENPLDEDKKVHFENEDGEVVQ